MDARITTLTSILRLNTKLLRNCLDGLTDEQAAVRPSPATNSAGFIAAHVADARFYLLTLLGAPQPNPLSAYLEGAKSIDDVKEFPPLDAIHRAWTDASHALRDRLDMMSAAELAATVGTRFPMADQTVLGALTFLVQHDTYHIGQLALLRKHLGFPAMRYE
jgi:uncharacterized damage-inducible protein DinB